jgi:hypothetical protein
MQTSIMAQIRLIKSLDTRRAGLAVDAFAPAVTPKRARKMLGARGHGWVEWLPDAPSTRVFGCDPIFAHALIISNVFPASCTHPPTFSKKCDFFFVLFHCLYPCF